MSNAARLVLMLALCTSLVACSDGNTKPGEPIDPTHARDLELHQLAVSLGISDPPDVEQVRVISSKEWVDVQISCLADHGFQVARTVDGEGIDSSGIPPAQAGKGGPYALALYTCEAMYPTDEGSGQWSDTQLSLLYDWYIEVEVPCLEDHGITVGTPPSRQTFIDTYYSPEGWIPYRAVQPLQLSPSELAALEAACPQEPSEPLG